VYSKEGIYNLMNTIRIFVDIYSPFLPGSGIRETEVEINENSTAAQAVEKLLQNVLGDSAKSPTPIDEYMYAINGVKSEHTAVLKNGDSLKLFAIPDGG